MRWVKGFFVIGNLSTSPSVIFSLHALEGKVLSIYRVQIVISFCKFECFIPMKCFSLSQFIFP